MHRHALEQSESLSDNAGSLQWFVIGEIGE